MVCLVRSAPSRTTLSMSTKRMTIRSHASHGGSVSSTCKKSVFDHKVVIGKGAQSIVYKWYNENQNRYVALKQLTGKTEDDDKVQHEIAMNEYMKHSQRFPTFYGCFCEEETVYLMNDFIAPGGSLFQLRYSHRDDGDEFFVQKYLSKRMFQDMCDFIVDCHSIGIIHRDVKLDNFVYCSSTQTTYGIDLGLSKRIHEPIDPTTSQQEASCLYEKPNIGRTGTLMYMSPEMLLKGPYTAKTDIWSLGVCFYELLYGRNPFTQNKEWKFTKQGVSQNSINKAFSRSMQGPVFTSDVSEDMNGIIREMLNPIESDRPTIFQVKEMIERLSDSVAYE